MLGELNGMPSGHKPERLSKVQAQIGKNTDPVKQGNPADNAQFDWDCLDRQA
jgi:hypothetical protein